MTQYLMPHGLPRATSVEIPDSLSDKVKEIKDLGLKFTAEMLPTRNIALYITDDKNEEDLAVEIADNGPGENSPKNCLIRMIENFKP